jgi:hypothetical protein
LPVLIPRRDGEEFLRPGVRCFEPSADHLGEPSPSDNAACASFRVRQLPAWRIVRRATNGRSAARPPESQRE